MQTIRLGNDSKLQRDAKDYQSRMLAKPVAEIGLKDFEEGLDLQYQMDRSPFVPYELTDKFLSFVVAPSNASTTITF